MDLPYLTRDLPGIGGRIKQHAEDFRVEEVPLYEPCGEGTHVYFTVEKTGLSTPQAVERIARHMGVHPPDVGLAGLKDARAVTCQRMSLEHVDEAKLAACSDSQMRIRILGRHGNKIRPGHLAGNRFRIRLRGPGAAQLPAARAILDALIRRGVPNYFGEQRFGARGDTGLLGAALLVDNLPEFLSLFLGRSKPGDPPQCKAARDAYDSGFLDRALKLWPYPYSNERRALSALKRSNRPGPAVGAIDKRMRRLFVSAFQSEVFNEILARRIDGIDRVLVGDLAEKTDTGGVFRVEDLHRENQRAAAFKISATGPLFGSRCNLATGEPGEAEHAVLERYGVAEGVATKVGTLRLKGSRRALRFKLGEPDVFAADDQHGPYLEITFAAPPGCYATVALREITKEDTHD